LGIRRDLREIVRLDDADHPRKAEYILALMENTATPRNEFIRSGLYEGGRGDTSPGALADAIARLVFTIPHRVGVMTTNYDNVLERALRRRMPGHNVVPCGPHDTEDWWSNIGSKNVGVLHLHGYLPPGGEGGDDLLPVILSESQYLRDGPGVRAEIGVALKRTLVIFVGVSLTDPNFIGPLHDAKGFTEPLEVFAILVPDSPKPENEVATPGACGLAYCAAQAEYLYKEFGVNAVVLKSYGQVTQCVKELSAAAERTDYIDPANGLHYGDRFGRVMVALHRSVRASNGSLPPSNGDAILVSNALHDALCAPDGPRNYINLFRGRNANTFTDLEISDSYLGRETFGLFLWLRQKSRAGEEFAPYAVFWVGRSAYVVRSASTLYRRVIVERDSPALAARAVFYGKAIHDVVKEPRPSFETWRTYHAVPLDMSEHDFDGAKLPYTMCIGAAVLQSNYCRVSREVIEEEKKRGKDVVRTLQPSVLSLMSRPELQELDRRIAHAATKAILTLHETTSKQEA
jgi:hypothetical protein